MEGRKNVIGVLRETKNYWECRTPVTPADAYVLMQKGIKVIIQPSSSRCFRDSEYESIGVEVNQDLSEASIILGVKEVLPCNFLDNRIYLFFSHTFKAQAYNMPMLDAMISKKITLIDYECIKNPEGNRTVALGKFGGNSGAMDFIQGIGKYLLMKNISTPFLCQGFGYMYRDLDNIRIELGKISDLIKTSGLPEAITPMIWGILGNGRSSQGVQEILKMLPHQILTPEELTGFYNTPESRYKIYIVVFPTNAIYSKISDGTFNRQEYHTSPFLYESIFAQKYSRYLSVIFNCLYYESVYPRVLRTEDIIGLDRLLGICDITCDFKGTIQICNKFTTPEEPFFLYKLADGRMYELCKTHIIGSVLYYSMDFLPSELPRDASTHLSKCLVRYIEELSNGDYEASLEKSGISTDLIDATLLYKGTLTPKYSYIEALRSKSFYYNIKIPQDTLEIANIVKEHPQLASDIDNIKHGQNLSSKNELAIIAIANVLKRRS